MYIYFIYMACSIFLCTWACACTHVHVCAVLVHLHCIFLSWKGIIYVISPLETFWCAHWGAKQCFKDWHEEAKILFRVLIHATVYIMCMRMYMYIHIHVHHNMYMYIQVRSVYYLYIHVHVHVQQTHVRYICYNACTTDVGVGIMWDTSVTLDDFKYESLWFLAISR